MSEAGNIEVLRFEIAKLELQPGDILIVRLPEGSPGNPKTALEVLSLEVLSKVLPKGVGVAVFKGDVEFTKARYDTLHDITEGDSE